ncbi:MAG: hypothetical protein ACT4R6_03495 [Gemmatimonadaceae bacterium]
MATKRKGVGRRKGTVAKKDARRRKPRKDSARAPSAAAAGSTADSDITRRDRRPPHRRLRVYALDPGASTAIDTALINEVALRVRWEDALAPGPVGEYLEVIDHDPGSACFYPPVDLNDPFLLAQDGLPPSEGNPQFHQQMVYAVAMTTIANFERALGRRAFWKSRREDSRDDQFVEKLRIYPHALRQANAYYSPAKRALLFGYFPADPVDIAAQYPGGTVFTCLSHDIVAHETAHALIDGMHRRFIEPTHPDVLAFHEAIADIVALFQHFSFPEVVKHQIARKRGDLASQSLLGELAQEFGRATGRRGALRSALGGYIDKEKHEWRPADPDPTDYDAVLEPHARGAILVGAVFDAFLSIYRARVADLFRLATGGSGVLPAGAIHPDLVARLADEAAKSAQHVLNMCIRALDYCPPVDLTFGEYLRAIITADVDLVPDDDRYYRLAFIEGFKRRGIYPRHVRSLSVDSLRWQQVSNKDHSREHFERIGRHLQTYVQQTIGVRRDRKDVFEHERAICAKLHGVIRQQPDHLMEQFEETTGLVLNPDRIPAGLRAKEDGVPVFEVHSARPARRAGPDGDAIQQVVVTITQRRRLPIDPALPESEENGFVFRGGCTVILDLDTLELQYAIRKRIVSENRIQRQREFLQGNAGASLRATYFRDPLRERDAEPFAFLHRPI